MNYRLEGHRQFLYEYFDKILSELIKKLIIQCGKEFTTNIGVYEIIKIEKSELDIINIENEKIHHLFSLDGCKVSGTIIVKAQAYPPNSERNVYTSHIFEIIFNPTTIKFDFEKETFSIEEDINISYISLTDRRIY
ncbi:MAG: hypothetical protein AB9833_05115 [Bacteroidales bacterium]